MIMFFHLRMLALLTAGLLATSPRADAQLFFSVTSSAKSILVNNSLTYTINLTNRTGGLLTVNVTNTFSPTPNSWAPPSL